MVKKIGKIGKKFIEVGDYIENKNFIENFNFFNLDFYWYIKFFFNFLKELKLNRF